LVAAKVRLRPACAVIGDSRLFDVGQCKELLGHPKCWRGKGAALGAPISESGMTAAIVLIYLSALAALVTVPVTLAMREPVRVAVRVRPRRRS
jgi:hypothetical protein